MVSKVKEFVSEQQQLLARQARKLGKAPGKVVRVPPPGPRRA